jgi:hypothetical protein
MSVDDARRKAMENCKKSAQKGDVCALVYVDNAQVHP